MSESLFSHFSVRTLLYIFYTMPGDVVQSYAMKKLYDQGWIYNKVEKRWFGPTKTGIQYYDIDTWEDKIKWLDALPGPESNYATPQEVKDNCPPLN